MTGPGDTHTDPGMAALYAEPFTIARPPEQTQPFIFASPHSGRHYPVSFVARSRLGPLALRRSEDAFVDEIFGSAVGLGAPLIAACFPRAFLDANRAASEIDSAMFDGALTCATDSQSPRVVAGLGVIPRIVRDGAEIYREKLSPDEVQERLTHLYHPYHDALAQLIAETREKFGFAILIDCHSMPSAAAFPNIVIGDRYGASASPHLTRLAEHAFETRGFSVARNTPYAGGHTTHLHGRRGGPVQALQIEISRALYLDEERVLPNAHFGALRARVGKALRSLLCADLSNAGLPRATPLAAE
ncbi:MAG TPA: N-formylglutamate amidohydrolase [Rhizomicrobium sp.]|nr:N-formylglutamate amidohydrolase [Rhizomicrobium sp.]